MTNITKNTIITSSTVLAVFAVLLAFFMCGCTPDPLSDTERELCQDTAGDITSDTSSAKVMCVKYTVGEPLSDTDAILPTANGIYEKDGGVYIDITFHNLSTVRITYGAPYTVQRRGEGDEWTDIEQADVYFDMALRSIEPNGERTVTYRLDEWFDISVAGEYRVLSRFSVDGEECSYNVGMTFWVRESFDTSAAGDDMSRQLEESIADRYGYKSFELKYMSVDTCNCEQHDSILFFRGEGTREDGTVQYLTRSLSISYDRFQLLCQHSHDGVIYDCENGTNNINSDVIEDMIAIINSADTAFSSTDTF